jgi:hypothetical protein
VLSVGHSRVINILRTDNKLVQAETFSKLLCSGGNKVDLELTANIINHEVDITNVTKCEINLKSMVSGMRENGLYNRMDHFRLE